MGVIMGVGLTHWTPLARVLRSEVKEIKTKERIMICDNKFQGSLYDYYVMSSDFTINNIATLEEVKSYLNDFTYDKVPLYTKMEERETKRLIKKTSKRG